MYLIDKPLYAIELPDGSLANDYWTEDEKWETFVTFCKISAEKQAQRHSHAKVVLYSQWWEEKTQREAAQREQMNPTSNGDDFPVVEPAESQYKFVLVNYQTGETVRDLKTGFVEDVAYNYQVDWDASNVPDESSSCDAAYEALRVLGYSVKVVKK